MKFFILFSVLAVLCCGLQADETDKSKGKVSKVKDKLKSITHKVNDKIADGIRHYLKIDEDSKKGNHKVDSETQLSAGETEILLRLRKNNVNAYHIDQYGNVKTEPSNKPTHDQDSGYNPSANNGQNFQQSQSPYAEGALSGSQSFRYNHNGQPMGQSSGNQIFSMPNLPIPNMPNMHNMPMPNMHNLPTSSYQGGNNQFMGNHHFPNVPQMINGRLPSSFSFGNGFSDEGDMNSYPMDSQSGYSMPSQSQMNSGNMNAHRMNPSGLPMENSNYMNSGEMNPSGRPMENSNYMNSGGMNPSGRPMENSNYMNSDEMNSQRMNPSGRPLGNMNSERLPMDNSNYKNNGEMDGQRVDPSGMSMGNSNYMNSEAMNAHGMQPGHDNALQGGRPFNGNMRPGMGPMGNGDDSSSNMGRRIASNGRRVVDPDRMQGTRVVIRVDDRDQRM